MEGCELVAEHEGAAETLQLVRRRAEVVRQKSQGTGYCRPHVADWPRGVVLEQSVAGQRNAIEAVETKSL